MKRRPVLFLVACVLISASTAIAGAQEPAADPTEIARQLLELEKQASSILEKLDADQRALVERALEKLRARADQTTKTAASTERPAAVSAVTSPGAAGSSESGPRPAPTVPRPSSAAAPAAASLPDDRTSPPTAPKLAEPKRGDRNEVVRIETALTEIDAPNSAKRVGTEIDKNVAGVGSTGADANDVSGQIDASLDTSASSPTCTPLIGLDSNQDGVLSGADRLWRHVYLTVDNARKDGVLSLFELDIRSVALDLRSFGTKGDSEGFIRRGDSYRFELIGKVARKTSSGLLTLDANGLSRSGAVQLLDAGGGSLEGFQILRPDQALLLEDGTLTPLGCSGR